MTVIMFILIVEAEVITNVSRLVRSTSISSIHLALRSLGVETEDRRQQVQCWNGAELFHISVLLEYAIVSLAYC